MKIEVWLLTVDGDDCAYSDIFPTEEALHDYLRGEDSDYADMDIGDIGEAMSAKWDTVTIDVPIDLEILHVRDPDSYCTHTVFVNGEQSFGNAGITIEDIDPGAGTEPKEWRRSTREIKKNKSLTKAFRRFVVDVRNQYNDSKWHL